MSLWATIISFFLVFSLLHSLLTASLNALGKNCVSVSAKERKRKKRHYVLLWYIITYTWVTGTRYSSLCFISNNTSTNCFGTDCEIISSFTDAHEKLPSAQFQNVFNLHFPSLQWIFKCEKLVSFFFMVQNMRTLPCVQICHRTQNNGDIVFKIFPSVKHISSFIS